MTTATSNVTSNDPIIRRILGGRYISVFCSNETNMSNIKSYYSRLGFVEIRSDELRGFSGVNHLVSGGYFAEDYPQHIKVFRKREK